MRRVVIGAKNHRVVALVITGDMGENEGGMPIWHDDEDLFAKGVFPKIEESRREDSAGDDWLFRFERAVHDGLARVSFKAGFERGEVGCGVLSCTFREFVPLDPEGSEVVFREDLQFSIGESAGGEIGFFCRWNWRRHRCAKELRLEEDAPLAFIGSRMGAEES